MLNTKNISYAVGQKRIVNNINANFSAGKISMILGPNGSGKSTYLKIFSGSLSGYDGEIFYGDQKISSKMLLTMSAYRAVLGQQPDLSFPMTVEEVVMMGRYPHFKIKPTAHDTSICNAAIDRLNLQSFKERNYLTLSGGEKQRVQFARVLAQIWEKSTNSPYRYLFLDEPLNNLDINYQQEFLQIAKSFCSEDMVIVAIMHDINLAIQFADEVYFLKDGSLVAQGEPSSTITETLIEQVFQTKTKLINNEETGKKVMVFKS